MLQKDGADLIRLMVVMETSKDSNLKLIGIREKHMFRYFIKPAGLYNLLQAVLTKHKGRGLGV